MVKEELLEKIQNQYDNELSFRIISNYPNNAFASTLNTKVLLNLIFDTFEKLDFVISKTSNMFLTSIITDEEVDVIVKTFYSYWYNFLKEKGWEYDTIPSIEQKTHPILIEYDKVDRQSIHLLRECVWTVPVVLFKNKYEFKRKCESNSNSIDKVSTTLIAKQLHHAYVESVTSNTSNALLADVQTDFKNEPQYLKDWDALPEHIKDVNLGLVHQLSVKLLTIGYKLEKTSEIFTQQKFTDNELEALAKTEHERWCWQKRISGYVFSRVKDEDLKLHPCLIPYTDLPEREKEKDRVMTAKLLPLFQALQLKLVRLTKSEKDLLPYVFQPTSLVESVKRSVLRWHNEMASYDYTPVKIANELNNTNNFEKKINELVGSFTAGGSFQRAFQGNPLSIQNIFPQSFILYKPRDIVGGDFCFVHEEGDKVLVFLGDCRGHSIQGALGTMVGLTFLDFYTKTPTFNISDVVTLVSDIEHHFESKLPSEINNNTTEISENSRKSIKKIDKCIDPIAFCIDKENNTITFAGNLKHILILSEGKPLYKYLLADKQVNTTHTSLNLKKGDTVYVFSDGYYDQVGGKEKTQLKRKNFLDKLTECSLFPIAEQMDFLLWFMEDFMKEGGEEQFDDIILFGVLI